MLSLKEHGHEYQLKGIRQGIAEPELAYFVDMGLGKTMMILHIIAILKRRGLLKKGVIIVCPILVAYNTWPSEIEKWTGTKDLTYSIVHGSNKLAALKRDVDIHITNFESIPWLHKTMQKSKTWPWEMLVVDESTKLKDSTTNRFKAIRPMIKLFKRKYILTATPIPNALYDIWAQWFLIDGGKSEFFGDNYNKWCNQHFQNFSNDFRYKNWKPLPGTKQAIQEEIRPKVLRLKAEDYLILPPLNSIKTELSFPKKLREEYRELKAESVYEYGDDEAIIVDNEANLTDKCRQFTQGAMYIEAGNHEYIPIHDIKLKMLEEKLEQLHGKRRALVTINYWFEADMIAKKFPNCHIIAGNNGPFIPNIVPSAKSKPILDQWNKGNVPYLFVHPASVSHGLNLQGGGDYLLFYSLPFSLDQYVQLIGRLWRQGQLNTVTVDHLLIKGSKDADIYRTLSERFSTQDEVLAYLNNETNPTARDILI